MKVRQVLLTLSPPFISASKQPLSPLVHPTPNPNPKPIPNNLIIITIAVEQKSTVSLKSNCWWKDCRLSPQFWLAAQSVSIILPGDHNQMCIHIIWAGVQLLKSSTPDRGLQGYLSLESPTSTKMLTLPILLPSSPGSSLQSWVTQPSWLEAETIYKVNICWRLLVSLKWLLSLKSLESLDHPRWPI